MENATLLAQARETFETAFVARLDGLFERAAEQLFTKADSARSTVECGTMLDARAALVNRGAMLRLELARHLDTLLNRALHTAFRWERAEFARVVDSGSLSLLDTSVVESKLALESLASRLRNAAGSELRDLNIRIAHLHRETVVQERENPFRPYVLVNALILSVATLGLVQEIEGLIVRELVTLLYADIAALYREVNALLARQGISADLPLIVRKTPRRPKPANLVDVPTTTQAAPAPIDSTPRPDLLSRWILMKTRPEQLRGAPAAPAGASMLDVAPNAGILLRSLFTHTTAAAQAARPAFTTYSGSTLLANAIRKLEHQASTRWAADASGNLRNYVFEGRVQLGNVAKSESEQTVIDVVAMLYEFILRDGQVPANVRTELGRTQFLLLKHGLFDPALFSQPQHPARRLLNRLGAVAMGFTPDDPVSANLCTAISRTVEGLLQADAIDLALFESALQDFDRVVDQTLRHANPAVSRAVRILEDADARNLQRYRIAGRLAALIHDLDLPVRLGAFLVDVWARVLERAERHESVQLARFRALVPQLAWSVLPKSSNESRVQMLKLLPDLVALLSDGMALGHVHQTERAEFMDWLVNANVAAIRDNGMGSTLELQVLETRFGPLVRNEEMDELGSEAPPCNVELLSEIVLESGEAITLLDAQFSPDAGEGVLVQGGAEPSAAYKEGVVARLRTGIMVEFVLGDLPRRARLNWISTMASSVLLSIEEMAEPSAISVGLLLRLMVRGQIRFMESEPMFERAVAALLRSADEMDHWRQRYG